MSQGEKIKVLVRYCERRNAKLSIDFAPSNREDDAVQIEIHGAISASPGRATRPTLDEALDAILVGRDR